MSIGGKNLLVYDDVGAPTIYSFVSFYDGDSDLGIPGNWVLWLVSEDSGSQRPTLWLGEKWVGVSPKGAYTRVLGSGFPDVSCDGLPDEICIEAY